MEALDVDTPFVEALRVATDSPYTRFPVYEESIDNVVGVVHARDLALAWTDDSVAPSMRELMRPALVLPDSMPADRLLTRLKEERHTMAILADEFGGTAGLITVDNILDELIGDIADEFQPDTPKPERLPDGRVRLPGTLRVEDAAQWARIRWDTRAVTGAGMVVTAFGHVPAEGERITLDGIDIEVERVTRRVVESVIITPPPPRRPHPATRADG